LIATFLKEGASKERIAIAIYFNMWKAIILIFIAVQTLNCLSQCPWIFLVLSSGTLKALPSTDHISEITQPLGEQMTHTNMHAPSISVHQVHQSIQCCHSRSFLFKINHIFSFKLRLCVVNTSTFSELFRTKYVGACICTSSAF
jgi:hypothetical protein